MNIKIWLKRIEPIDLYKDVNEVRLAFIYSTDSALGNYLTVDRTISRDNDPVIDFGIWLSKFYRGNVRLFYKTYMLEFKESKLLRSVKLYGK